MSEKYRTHDIAITFSKPVSEKAARIYLANAMQAIESFRVLSKAAWEYDRTPKIEKSVVRRK